MKTTAQQFAEGLVLIADAIDSGTFYSSDCGNAHFTLNRPLSHAEQETLRDLGFGYCEPKPAYNAPARVVFSEWE